MIAILLLLGSISYGICEHSRKGVHSCDTQTVFRPNGKCLKMDKDKSEDETSKYFTKEKCSSGDTNRHDEDHDIDPDDDHQSIVKDKLNDKDDDEDAPSYSNGDFLTGSEGDDDGVINEAEACEPKKKKLIQPTLNFGSSISTRSSTTSEKKEKRKASTRSRWNDADTENYRNGYPDQEDDLSLRNNLLFYKGEICSFPDGDYIDAIHTDWFGRYETLERHHGYIQWLFPIRERGMNWHAQALQLHEAKYIQEDQEAQRRVMMSFKLMLDFYGMKLDDEETGQISRSKNWKKQFENFNWSSHNFLRITRILKSLGELGFERLKKPFLLFIMKEALEYKTLSQTIRSCRDYWIGTIKSDVDRTGLYSIIENGT